MYLGVVKYLPQRVNIIAVDLFGHGETSLNEEEVYSFDTYVKYLKKVIEDYCKILINIETNSS